MPVCTVILTYEVYEGSLGTVPLPLCSWTVYINGLEDKMRRGMVKFCPELGEAPGCSSLTCSQTDKTRTYLNMASTLSIATKYLKFLDGEGYKIVGQTCDSSIYSGGLTKTYLFTLQSVDGCGGGSSSFPSGNGN